MNKILFIDTMTTGMNQSQCCIYRLGGIITEDGAERQRFELRMCPPRGAKIFENSLYITGETKGGLLRYPDEKTVLDDFIRIISKYVNLRNPLDKIYIAGFNVASFDIAFLREWFRRNGNETFRNYFHMQTIDLMSIAAYHLMDERNRMDDFHLETVARYLGVPFEGGRSYDCLANAKLCLDIYRKLKTGETVEEQEKTETYRNYDNGQQ